MPERIADEKQIERQWMILNKIGRRYGATKQQLIKEVGVSERTIERDIRILMRYFPSIIEEKDGRQKRYRIPSGLPVSSNRSVATRAVGVAPCTRPHHLS